MSKTLMSGNEAVARGAYEAGARFAASYPGTPATEVLENMTRYDEIRAHWTVNEKVALEEAIGAAVAGARSVASMKHVGMNVAADPLFTSSYIGVKGGLVIINADDPGMHSSQNEQDNRHYARAAKLPMLEPADSAETKEFVRFAFDISEKYDTPVIVRMTTRISHAKGIVELGERTEHEVTGFEREAPKYVMLPGYARGRHAVVEKRMEKLGEMVDESELNAIIPGDKSLGIISSGVALKYALEAERFVELDLLGHRVGKDARREGAHAVVVVSRKVLASLGPLAAQLVVGVLSALLPPERADLGDEAEDVVLQLRYGLGEFPRDMVDQCSDVSPGMRLADLAGDGVNELVMTI